MPGRKSGKSLSHSTIAECIATYSYRGNDLFLLSGTRISYGQLSDTVDRVAGQLAKLGISSNHCVALLVGEREIAVPTTLALACCAVAAPLAADMSHAELRFAFAKIKPAAVVVGPGVAARTRELLVSLDVLTLEIFDASMHRWEIVGGSMTGDAPAAPDRASGQVALRLLTSGTSGTPKRVDLDHSQLLLAASRIASTVDLDQADRLLMVLPAYHIHGFSTLLASVLVGASILVASSPSPDSILEAVSDSGITWVSASPTYYRALLRAMDSAAREYIAPRLRLLRTASSPMPEALAVEIEQKLGVPLIEAYGMTEAGPLIASNRLAGNGRRRGSVGQAVGVQIRIIDEDGRPLADGETGEITIRGDAVISSYPESVPYEPAFLPNGWFRTGDLGYLDAQGFLFITGRTKEIINRGGEKIRPADIEAVLMSHPAVDEAVAYPAPHQSLGEVPHAVVCLRPAYAVKQDDFHAARRLETGLLEHCKASLSSSSVPLNVYILEAIPSAPDGKYRRLEQHKIMVERSLPVAAPAQAMLPPGQIETAVLAVWTKVLGYALTASNADFFSSGGDSLAAISALVEMENQFAVTLPEDFFMAFTRSDQQAERISVLQSLEQSSSGEPNGSASPELDRIAPLTRAQRRLWFLDQEGAGSEYTMCLSLWLNGPLDSRLLEQAFCEVVGRHQALHTSVQRLGRQPVQVIRADWVPDWQLIDLSHIPEKQREQEVMAFARQQRHLEFDLAGDALICGRLISLGAARHALITTVHHIVFDGWSVGIFYRELFGIYASLAGDSGYRPPALHSHYFHSALAEKVRRDSDVFRADVAWWESQMYGVDQRLVIPGAKTVTGQPNPNIAAHQYVSLEHTLAHDLKRVSAQLGVSLYACLATALKIVLYRYTGQKSFALGTVSANRTGVDQQKLIGMFASTLPMPVALQDDHEIKTAIIDTWQFLQSRAAHNSVDFEDIVEACCEYRTAGVTPLFQIMFAYQNLPEVEFPITAGGAIQLTEAITGEQFFVEATACKFDVGLYVQPTLNSLDLTWQYRSAKYDAGTIALVNEHFRTVLQTMVTDPELSLGDIPLASRKPEMARVGDIAAANTGSGPLSLMQRVSANALASPDRVAISAASRSLTYRQLVEAANQLANYLISIGVGAGQAVAVLLPRNEQYVVAPLAIMTAGAIYVPLDCSQPQTRIHEILSQASVGYALVNDHTAGYLPASASVAGSISVISLDVCAAVISQQSSALPVAEHVAEKAAYVVFTSGSTGVPKGVALSHDNLAHYLEALNQRLGISAHDRYLHTAPFAFSSAIRQMFLPLAYGGQVIIASADQVRNVGKLISLAATEAATVLDLVPSNWRNILSYCGLDGNDALQLPEVRVALSASEPLYGATATFIRNFCPGSEIFNMYGQTETTGIVGTASLVRELEESSVIPLGEPIPGVSFILLDERGRHVPMGSAGEICVAGKTVGLGYLRPEDNVDSLGQERFFRRAGVGAIYRTGDLGRFSAEGTLQYCGRLDSAFKHLGHRVEPGEVECIANTHPAVASSAAYLGRARTADGYKSLQLIYCRSAAASGTGHIDRDLRHFLRQRLPAYMVPLKCTAVTRLPLTASGKIERSGLESFGSTEQSPVPNHQLSSTEHGEVANALLGIWRQTLGVQDIGLQDNFFDLGGNSLLSLEIVSSALDAGIDLSLDQLFHYQTLDELVPAILEQPPAGSIAEPGQPGGGQCADRTGVSVNHQTASPASRFDIQSLRRFGLEVLTKAGLPEEGARIVTEVQLESSLRGQPTHNIGDIPRYGNRLVKGILNARPAMRKIDTSPVSAIVEGDNAPGQWVATVAVDHALTLAEKSGIGVVAVRGSNHYGAAGHYVWRVACEGFIGMGFSNGPVILAPTGGVTPLFGNNPLAVGLPCATRDPVVLDIAMSVATRGKIGLAVAEGRPLPAGWILDESGMPSTALEDLAAGLGIPIGGHKGYGLAFVIEVLAGALTGAGYCRDHSHKNAAIHGGSNIGHLFVVIKPSLFMPRQDFERRVLDIVGQAKSSELASGVNEIFVPGEIELRQRQENLIRGVPVQASAVSRLRNYAARHGIESPLHEV